jgi:hypothetical protein
LHGFNFNVEKFQDLVFIEFAIKIPANEHSLAMRWNYRIVPTLAGRPIESAPVRFVRRIRAKIRGHKQDVERLNMIPNVFTDFEGEELVDPIADHTNR